MATVAVRPMTRTEFDEWQLVLADEYAADQVEAADGQPKARSNERERRTRRRSPTDWRRSGCCCSLVWTRQVSRWGVHG